MAKKFSPGLHPRGSNGEFANKGSSALAKNSARAAAGLPRIRSAQAKRATDLKAGLEKAQKSIAARKAAAAQTAVSRAAVQKRKKGVGTPANNAARDLIGLKVKK